jgi:GR25 family glycosyltransferase involved in LPS biosynthesis
MIKLNKVFITGIRKTPEERISEFNKIQFPYNVDCEVVSGINGWKLEKGTELSPYQYRKAPWWKIDSDFRFYNREVTPGEVGCTLSHYKAVELGYNQGCEHILIFEDDFTFTENPDWETIFKEVPEDYDLLYLARNPLHPEKEEQISDNIIKVDYTFNNQAYLVSRAGMKKILDSPILDNIIVWDEFIPALNGTSDREDAVKIFSNNNFNSYATVGQYFGQDSTVEIDSATEFDPELISSPKITMKNTNSPKPADITATHNLVKPSLTEFEITDDSPNVPFILDYIKVLSNKDNFTENQAILSNMGLPYPVTFTLYTFIKGHELGNDDFFIPFTEAKWWAIDSSSDSWEEGNPNNQWYINDVTPADVANALTHFKAISDAYQDGIQNLLVLKDGYQVVNTFPSEEYLQSIPEDASIVYLGRSPQNIEKEYEVNQYITSADYTYGDYAYLITRKGMEEILNSMFLDNVIIWDEFLSAINNTSDRKDAVELFGNNKFKAYSFKETFFTYSLPNQDSNSTTPTLDVTTTPSIDTNSISILDQSDWDLWCSTFINPLILNKEYDLAIDEPAPHVYVFPFFTEEFCSQLIKLGEQFKWTTDRHAFYPTTDNLLEVLGMEKIYNRLINDFVRPLAIDRYGLEGKSWDHLTDESFIIKYPYNQQSHLSLHHDQSNITTLVNLNSGEFEGGGTYFPKYKCCVNPKQIGVMTLHPGSITHKHGARPVTKGTRYVVVSFIKSKDHTAY